MSRSFSYYDELSRPFRSDADLFMPEGINTVRPVVLEDGDMIPGDGRITAFVDYDRSSRITFATAASRAWALETVALTYDGMGRTMRISEPCGSEVIYEHDKNSNVVRATAIARNPSGRVPEEQFVSLYVHDALNRVARSTDTLGQTRRFYYDSRGLAIKVTDAQGPLIADPLGLYSGEINADGNVSEVIYDGLGRPLKAIREMRTGGEGGNSLDLSNPANPDGKVIESTVWDKNSRVVSVSDDKGNPTSYCYDELNRLSETIFADGTRQSVLYDRDNNLIRYTDSNGSVVISIHDALNRLVRSEIERGQDVEGTTLQTFEYDGLSRLTKATDNNDPEVSDDSAVERRYDSLGRLVEEVQNGKVVSMNWREDDDRSECIYPSGRKMTYSRDRLDRITAINDGGTAPIAAYDYIGSRLLERVYRNGTRLTMLNDTGTADSGYDRLGRLVEMRHVSSGNTLVAGFSYGYNRENHKLYQENLTHPNLSEIYRYDSLYRLVDTKRGSLTWDKADISGEVGPTTQNWGYDGVGNWVTTTSLDLTQGCCGACFTTLNTYNQQIDEMNEYTSFGDTPQSHDDNGNLIDEGRFTFAFDFANRITEVRSKEHGTLIARYTYDAFNRRTAKYIQRRRAFKPDDNTLALYHLDETEGDVLDSSGNDNHGRPAPNMSQGVPGLFGTPAACFHAAPVHIEPSPSLDNVQDKLTLETYVCMRPVQVKGAFLHRESSFRLAVENADSRIHFTIFTQGKAGGTDKVEIKSDSPIEINRWIYVRAVYDGSEIRLYLDDVLQSDVKAISGNVKLSNSPLLLGGIAFKSSLEEIRISNCVRKSVNLLQKFYYDGWRLIEEREHIAIDGEALGSETLRRQFADGALGIDEHLCTWIYDDSGAGEGVYYYHENHRGDTVALTDISGSVVLRCTYSAYGIPLEIDQNGQLRPLQDVTLVRYGFQGRDIDGETGLYYFRNRYYSAEQGRFLSRDMLGYHDSMGLYSAFEQNPISWGDPWGNFRYRSSGDPVIDDFMKVVLANIVREYEAKTTTGTRLRDWFENIQHTGDIGLQDFYQPDKGPEIIVTDLGSGTLATTPNSQRIEIDRAALETVAKFWASTASPSASTLWIDFFVRDLFHEAVHAITHAHRERLNATGLASSGLNIEYIWIMEYRVDPKQNIVGINPTSPDYSVLTWLFKHIYENEEGRLMEFFVWRERINPKVEKGGTSKIPCPPKYVSIWNDLYSKTYPPSIEMK